MKMTKIAAIVAAAALLIVGAAFTSMAATGWQYEGDTWVYYDAKGEMVFDKWVQSGAGQWFWLDDNGEMAVNQLIDNEKADHSHTYYYVGADGARVENTWIKVYGEDYDDDETDFAWYYFQVGGKAYKNTKKEINGKTYFFGTDAKMLSGWVVKNGDNYEALPADVDTSYADGLYYCGDAEDGSMKTLWQSICINPNGDADEFAWFYFGTNGKKVDSETLEATNGVKKIDGNNYKFDDEGKMLTGWIEVGSPSDAFVAYYDMTSGAAVTKGWFKAYDPTTAPLVTDDDYSDCDIYWFYYDGHTLAKSCLKTIKGKLYAFDQYGRMQSGVVSVPENTTVASTGVTVTACDTEAKLDAEIAKSNVDLYYFGDAEDGSAKTGTQTMTVGETEYTLTFNSKAQEGVAAKYVGTKGWSASGKVFYQNGKKFTAAAETGYQLVKLEAGDVDVDGTIVWTSIDPFALGAESFWQAKNNFAYADSKWTTSENFLVVDENGNFKSSMSRKDADDYQISVSGYLVTQVVAK